MGVLVNVDKAKYMVVSRSECRTKSSSSSSPPGGTTSIFECVGLLNLWFPVIAILDAASLVLYFQLLMSFLMSSSHLFFGLPSGFIDIGFHLHTLFTIMSSCIRCKWPNQLNRCAFIWSIMFLCLINSSYSSFVLILLVPSLSFVRPKIFLDTFLSNTINLFFIVSFKTHASQACVTIGHIILQYSFNFDFLETNLLLKRNWLA